MAVTTTPRAPGTGSAPARVDRTARGHVRSPVWSWGLAFAFVAMAVAAGWWVTHSAIFGARTITISGNHRLTDAQVQRLGGIGQRTNVLWFSPDGVEVRLEASPWISSAQVSRTLPSTISITVSELTALAVLDTGSSRFLIAGDGTVLAPAPRGSSLPVIRVSGPVRAGSRVLGARGQLQVVATLPAEIRSRVVRVEVDSARGLVVSLTGGIEALYGDAADAAAKGQALAAILSWAERGAVHLATVDVRIPATPVARPVPPAPTSDPSVSSTATDGPTPPPR